jgi:hypothetical protein
MNLPGGTAALQVSDNGLRVQAAWWEAADALAGDTAPAAVAASWSASAAAVNAAHEQITAASTKCTSRVQATATKLALAATSYTENEDSSAAQMRALYGPTVC